MVAINHDILNQCTKVIHGACDGEFNLAGASVGSRGERRRWKALQPVPIQATPE